MKRRKGESFTEFLTASLVFGIIMAGLFEFMANQTENVAMIKDRDTMMFYAQKYANTSKEPPKDAQKLKDAIDALKKEAEKENVTLEPSNDEKKLTVKKGLTELSFALTPEAADSNP